MVTFSFTTRNQCQLVSACPLKYKSNRLCQSDVKEYLSLHPSEFLRRHGFLLITDFQFVVPWTDSFDAPLMWFFSSTSSFPSTNHPASFIPQNKQWGKAKMCNWLDWRFRSVDETYTIVRQANENWTLYISPLKMPLSVLPQGTCSSTFSSQIRLYQKTLPQFTSYFSNRD